MSIDLQILRHMEALRAAYEIRRDKGLRRATLADFVAACGMPRAECRAALARLVAAGRLRRRGGYYELEAPIGPRPPAE